MHNHYIEAMFGFCYCLCCCFVDFVKIVEIAIIVCLLISNSKHNMYKERCGLKKFFFVICCYVFIYLYLFLFVCVSVFVVSSLFSFLVLILQT